MHARKHPSFEASLTPNTGSEVSDVEPGDPTFHPRQIPRDLAGKYGDQAVSQVILKSGSNSADSQNPPLGDSSLGTLSTG